MKVVDNGIEINLTHRDAIKLRDALNLFIVSYGSGEIDFGKDEDGYVFDLFKFSKKLNESLELRVLD